VLALIADGLTNKEIAHLLLISERGAAASVSRLLEKFAVPNRAGLVARAINDRLNAESSWFGAVLNRARSAWDQASEAPQAATPSAPELLIALMVGDQHEIAMLNTTAASVLGIDLDSAGGVGLGERFADPSALWWTDKAETARRTGAATVAEAERARWRRDDGSWTSATFTCVFQPLSSGEKGIQAVLVICNAGELTSSPAPAFKSRH
jgi:PAS domain-containing protein